MRSELLIEKANGLRNKQFIAGVQGARDGGRAADTKEVSCEGGVNKCYLFIIDYCKEMCDYQWEELRCDMNFSKYRQSCVIFKWQQKLPTVSYVVKNGAVTSFLLCHCHS